MMQQLLPVSKVFLLNKNWAYEPIYAAPSASHANPSHEAADRKLERMRWRRVVIDARDGDLQRRVAQRSSISGDTKFLR
jgi:hypothetical protein